MTKMAVLGKIPSRYFQKRIARLGNSLEGLGVFHRFFFVALSLRCRENRAWKSPP